MSKIKSPQEKKRKSLLKDRRNVYGECPTSSRKNIRRGKQRSHMALRRIVAGDLRTLKNGAAEVEGENVETRAKAHVVKLSRSSFKKMPDAPLAVVVSKKARKQKRHREGQQNVFTSCAEFSETERNEARMLRKLRRP